MKPTPAHFPNRHWQRTALVLLLLTVSATSDAATPFQFGGGLADSAITVLFAAFGAGILLAFTPCVLPMLPILLGSIATGNPSPLRATSLALAYVLGSAFTYAIAGAVAGASGEQLQAYFQTPWAIGALVTLLLLMALAMFGGVPLQLPTALQSRLHHRLRGLRGALPVVFALGAFSALLVGACVSPVLISLLSLAVSAGDPWLGAQIMASVGFGMGVPLLLLGVGAGHLLPKAGAWMQRINHLFGILLVGLAIYLLNALPQLPILIFWGAYLCAIAIYLHRAQRSEKTTPRYLRRGLTLGLAAWGVVAVAGGALGGRDLLKPIPLALLTQTPSAEAKVAFTRIHTPEQLGAQLAAAANRKWVLVDFYADWCVDCLRMEATTFRDPRVREIIARDFVALQVDVTDPYDPDTRALKKLLGVFGPPAVLFITPQGIPAVDKNFYGYLDAEAFLALLKPPDA